MIKNKKVMLLFKKNIKNFKIFFPESLKNTSEIRIRACLRVIKNLFSPGCDFHHQLRPKQSQLILLKSAIHQYVPEVK